MEANRQLADRIMDQMRRVPGIADLRIQQTFDQPKLHVFTDRTKAAESGYTQNDVAQSLLISLSGSFQTQPTFWLNPQNGVSYNVVTQAPQYDCNRCRTCAICRSRRGPPGTPEILNDVTSITRGNGMASVNHYDIQRVIDIYGAVDGRDLGSRRPRGGTHSRCQPQESGARLGDADTRASGDHARLPSSGCWPA